MKQCTVFGGQGYIGQNLVNHLKFLGHDVLVPGRNEYDFMGKQLGHVFYCIGLTADFRKRPFDTVRAHVTMLSDLLEQAIFDSFLYLSSTRVYQTANSGNEKAKILVNSQDPSDLYNISKLMGESLCLACRRNKVRIARLSNVIGRQDSDSENFLSVLYREAKAGKIVLQTACTSTKDYIHIDDVIDLLSRIAFEGRYKIYNVASGIQITHAQWVDRLKTLLKCVVEVSPDAPEVLFPPIDISRIQNEFTFFPKSVIDLFDSSSG